MSPEVTLAALRKAISGLDPGVSGRRADLFQLGAPDLDAALGGGLARGALHEIYARRGQDAVAAAGFGLGFALRAAGDRALLWARQEFIDIETGGLYGDGLAAFGLDPERLLIVRTHDAAGALRATAEAARCPAIGAALVEVWSEPKTLNLKASRRLGLAAGVSGVTVVMIRLSASPAPSAATSRWSVAAAASMSLEANAPGRPAFEAALLRHRAGLPPRTWRLEWNRDRASFEAAPLSRAVVSVPVHRPASEDGDTLWRHAG